ncbi:MAG: HIT family protein [Myxococcota bacterium]
MSDRCIFCMIATHQAEATRVYEDADTMAFADIFPFQKGHLLVIPRTHVENIYTLPDELAASVFRTTARMARILKEVLKPDGMTLIQANEKAGGQDVFHMHIHVVPRWENQNVNYFSRKRVQVSRTELECTFREVGFALGGDRGDGR